MGPESFKESPAPVRRPAGPASSERLMRTAAAPPSTAEYRYAQLTDGPPFLTGAARIAACASTDVELFYPKIPTSEAAVSLCRRCPVRRSCLSHAELTPERFGIWGGLTPRERGWGKYGQPLSPKEKNGAQEKEGTDGLPTQGRS